MIRKKIVTLLILLPILILSSCSPMNYGFKFPFSKEKIPYQINTFPIDGKYIQTLGSNGNKICYYSYDVDANYCINQKNIDIIEFDFRTLEQKIIYSIPSFNVFYSKFQKEILGVSYNQIEEPILFFQTLTNGISSIYSVYLKQKHLLYSQKAHTYPIYYNFFSKPNVRIRFKYLILVYQHENDNMKIVVDSIENGHLRTLEVPKIEFNWYETNNQIWFFSKTTNASHTLYKLDKETFTLKNMAEYKGGRIVGIDFVDDYIFVTNETNKTIEIMDSTGIMGSIPCTFPIENIDFVISKKFENYYSLFVLLRTTVDGVSKTVPWIRFYPKNKKVTQKMLSLPAEYKINASKYYERKNDEFIATVMKQETREMNLIFFYFSRGLITFEPLYHRVDKNMTIKRFTYLPGYYFTWSEYTQIEKFNDYNYQVYYCSLNRLQAVVDQINKKP